MKITVQQLPKSEVKITIEVPEERLQKFEEQAAKQISEHVKIPGFRPGHVPLDILKQNVNPEALESHTLDLALPQTYGEAVMKEKLQVVSRPKINIVTVKPLVYEATVAVYPKVEVSGYDKLNIKKNEIKVEDKDIEEVLKDIQKRSATFKEVDRAAQMGDRVEVDFEGFDEGGALLEKTKSKNHPLVLGEGSLVKGFEEEIVGLKKDEKKSFKIAFPKDYFHKPFQDKTVEFRVEVKKVEETITPEWTPDFIKKITGAEKTMDQVKEMIHSNLTADKKEAERNRRENEFLEGIMKNTKVELPETLIEEEIDALIEELKNELSQMGATLEIYLEQNKKEMKDIRAERRKEAEKRLTLRFGLQQIFEQEKIEVKPEEIEKELEHLISLYPPKEQPKIRTQYEKGSYLMRRMENRIRMEKLFERFLGK